MSFHWNKPKTSPREVSIPKSKILSKSQNDVIISDLEHNSIRWMKNHRNSTSTIVVLQTEQHKKFQEIFSAFDFEGEGDLALSDLNSSLDYISKSPYFSSKAQKKLLHDLQIVFTAMDTGGDGSVNFSEFCIGMSGEASKVINKMDKFETAKLFEMILEYANTVKRKQSLTKISDADDSKNISDVDMLQHFNALFSLLINKEKPLYMCDEDSKLKKESSSSSTSSSLNINKPNIPENTIKRSEASPRARKINSKPSTNNDAQSPIKQQIVNTSSIDTILSIKITTKPPLPTTTTTTATTVISTTIDIVNDNDSSNNLMQASVSEQLLKTSILEYEEKQKTITNHETNEISNNNKRNDFFASLKLDLQKHNLNTDIIQ